MQRIWHWLWTASGKAAGSAEKGIALLILRIVFGGLMLYGHGWGKLTGFAEKAPVFRDPIGIGSTPSMILAMWAEVFCALLLVVGLATRLAAIPLMITMLVAAFLVHLHDPFPKFELPLLYLAGYAALLLMGPGRYSLDGWMARRRG